MGHHPGDQAMQVASNDQSSLLAWIIIIVVLALIGYGLYWLFKKDEKRF